MAEYKAFGAVLVALYLAVWGASGCTAWGQNEGVKCLIGYDVVTSLCIDPPHMPKCSGWSPPGFCWRRRASQGEGP